MKNGVEIIATHISHRTQSLFFRKSCRLRDSYKIGGTIKHATIKHRLAKRFGCEKTWQNVDCKGQHEIQYINFDAYTVHLAEFIF
jgi:hypothetical protein